MQTFREELKEKNTESLKKQREYEARVQEVEARLQPRMEGSAEEHRGQQPQVDERMQLITPEVAATLSIAAQKQKAPLTEALENHTKAGTGWDGRRQRVTFQNEEGCVYDAEMDSDADRRDAGTSQFESAWLSGSVVNFS